MNKDGINKKEEEEYSIRRTLIICEWEEEFCHSVFRC